MKSIIIFGKGPSVLKCTRKIVDDHDEIAICNYPPLNDFFYSLIKDKTIHYHFANCGTFDPRWTNELNHKLQIQKIFNTNRGTNNYMNYLNNNTLFQNENLYQTIYKDYYYNIYKSKPNTGVMALQYILNTKLYDKITLVGFDGFKLGSTVYYYDMRYLSQPLKYLVGGNGPYNKNGKILVDNLEHPFDITFKYLNDTIQQNSNINFTFITNIKFDKNYNNLSIL